MSFNQLTADAKHTPGPWQVREASYGWDIFNADLSQWVGYGTKTVEDGSIPHYPTKATSEANAKLCAAAPTLLEAAEKLLRWRVPHDDQLTVTDGSRQALRDLRAAIASATA